MNGNNENPESDADGYSAGEGMVCTACLEVNSENANYCIKCGAPLNSLLAFNPFDQTLVEGFAYRRAVDGPPSKIIVVGIWLIFGPPLLSASSVITSGARSVSTLSDVPGFLAVYAFFIAYFLVAALIICRTTANYFSKRKISS